MSARAWRALTYGVPLAFFGLFFLYPLAAIVERGLTRSRRLAARRAHRPADARGRVVHGLAGHRLDAPHPRRRDAGRLRARPLPLSRPERRERPRPSCRSCCRPWSSRSPSSPFLPDRFERGWAPILVSARVLQRRRRRPDRRDVSGRASIPRLAEAAATLGARPVDALPRSHAPAARSRSRLPPPRSSSSSPSPPSAWSSSSAARAMRRSRRRSTTRPSASSTSARLRCFHSCSSRACSPPCGSATRLESRLVVHRSAAPRDRHASPGANRGGRGSSSAPGSACLRSSSASRSPSLVERSLVVGGGHGLDGYRALATRRACSSPHRGRRS